MIPRPRRSTSLSGNEYPEEPTLGRAAPRPRLRMPFPPQEAEPAPSTWSSGTPTLYAEAPVAMASVIAQESIVSRESGALRMMLLAAGSLLVLLGAVALLKMAGRWLLG